MPSLFFASLLLILALIQTLKQSWDMYKATKKWQPNRYIKLLMRDGIIYFVLYVALLFYHFSSPCMFPPLSSSPFNRFLYEN